jgi:hypothetical protein
VPLRLLVRAAPFVLGAVAAALWLRGRQPERPALPARTGPVPPASPPAARPPSRRFVRASERRAVDIVTVVDDLLGASR